MQTSVLAAHRFGFAEARLIRTPADAKAWVLGQFPSDGQALNPFDAAGLSDAATAFRIAREANQTVTRAQGGDEKKLQEARQILRDLHVQGIERRWNHVVATDAPVAERWVQFWSNHFCVAATKASVTGLVWPHENEAIRPHAQGRFFDMLKASTQHPAMLLYLDNAQSIGPDSRAGQRRQKGLNENLARELLELHTLGVNGGYTQADVTETARLLTGWTVEANADGASGFQPRLHQPGSKTVLGRRYPEGPQALDLLLNDLSRHPATARHLATKLARHFVTDSPPTALIDAVASRFLSNDGDLRATARALFEHPMAWETHPAKFKRPEELLLSAHRMLKLPFAQTQVQASVQAVQLMGQAMGRAPSPQGWPDRSDDWLSPDALFKRVQWAERFAKQHADKADARALAQQAMGADLSESTRKQIDQAESSAQALALWLVSPEFQRR